MGVYTERESCAYTSVAFTMAGLLHPPLITEEISIAMGECKDIIQFLHINRLHCSAKKDQCRFRSACRHAPRCTHLSLLALLAGFLGIPLAITTTLQSALCRRHKCRSVHRSCQMWKCASIASITRGNSCVQGSTTNIMGGYYLHCSTE